MYLVILPGKTGKTWILLWGNCDSARTTCFTMQSMLWFSYQQVSVDTGFFLFRRALSLELKPGNVFYGDRSQSLF